MRLRRAALRLHRWGGLATGAVVSVVALSGAAFLLAADVESRRTAERWAIEPAAGAERASPSELLAAARTRHPELSPLSVEIRRNDTRAAVVRFREGVAAYLDPWSGRVLGERGEGATLSGRLVSLHTQLFAGEPGRLVVLIATIVLVALVPLGLVLWWPRRRPLARRAVLPAGSSSTIRVLVAESPDGDATRYHTVRVGGDGAVRRIDRYGDASPAERLDRLVNYGG